ncbi:50S ribosomal protein L6 [Anaeromyxobacter oryzae]|uniref:Large ribosomal subunit protein uL6 n=1 Tax=Anaeromyxobacter oryzae TaxID=2918170 RepID=A0ABM7X4P4_9BACT|nr:50S ribosomal protein L6 [Anaeromyxobacter oryzae]BDG06757.1 50S ribosomal protein L6 [Anaeromyxobacter oryzae]
MSRVGKMPVKIPEKVKVSVDGHLVKVEGPKGKMSFNTNPIVKVQVDKGEVKVTRPDDTRIAKGLHGLTRTMVKNALDGVVKGYERGLEISGVGFKAEVKGKDIHFTLGFSHPVVFKLPEGVTAEVDAKQTKLTVKGVDKHLLGLTAAKIRALRPPEPYKGKGIKYAEETIRRKEGKTGAA